jgi:methylenetetrahydrofolate dehydrogenase (NADP+)/methenyltetrahydrofolate cyclohydrolase
MTAQLLDGKRLAGLLREDMRLRIVELAKQQQRLPGLAVILVGNDPASQLYVANKYKACQEVGIKEFAYNLPSDSTQNELLALIDTLNQDPAVDGILLQLPLPEQINKDLVLERIDPSKDVDGFHPYNLGCLVARKPALRPCTPQGIIRLLAYYDIDVIGKHAVVIGASNIVGRPMSLELLLLGATTTICHRFTQDLGYFIQQADIVISATGQAGLIQEQWIKLGACVVDVGISRGADGQILGDVKPEAKERAAWITPVPGGVGPMTIVSLLKNTLLAAKGEIY